MEYAGEKPAKFLNEGGLPTSDLLPENLWPEGFDKDKINTISFKNAMKLKKLQDESKKEEDERIPGVSISKPDKPIKPIKLVTVPAGTDNATTILHVSRFTLRPPMCPPKDYWLENMQKKRKDSPANPSVAFLGAAQQVEYSQNFVKFN